jgi:hypothetical protein
MCAGSSKVRVSSLILKIEAIKTKERKRKAMMFVLSFMEFER